MIPTTDLPGRAGQSNLRYQLVDDALRRPLSRNTSSTRSIIAAGALLAIGKHAVILLHAHGAMTLFAKRTAALTSTIL
jgi:hypothetical protein